MVAAAALGDVVEQPGQQQHVRLAQARPDLVGDAESFVGLAREAVQVGQHRQRVLVDGVDVEQVVLHAPRDLAEGRQVARQHAQAGHAGQRGHGLGRLQQVHELPAQRFGLVGVRTDSSQRFTQGARGFRMQAAGIGLLVPGNEQRQHRREAFAQPRRFGHGQVAVAQLVAIAQRHRFFLA